jgi:hypothetical protein
MGKYPTPSSSVAPFSTIAPSYGYLHPADAQYQVSSTQTPAYTHTSLFTPEPDIEMMPITEYISPDKPAVKHMRFTHYKLNVPVPERKPAPTAPPVEKPREIVVEDPEDVYLMDCVKTLADLGLPPAAKRTKTK